MITEEQLDKFKNHFKGRRKSSEDTLNQYRYFIERVKKDLPDNIKLFDINSLNDLLKRKDNYHYQHMLRAAILRWLEFLCYQSKDTTWGMIEDRIKKQLFKPRATSYKFVAKNLSDTQMNLILDNVKNTEDKGLLKYKFPLHLALNMLFDTGLRRAEFLRLEPRHFELINRRIHVTYEIAKSKEERYVFYTESTSELLIKYLFEDSWIDKELHWKNKKYQKTVFVLKNIAGEVLKFQSIRFTQLVSKTVYPNIDGRGGKPKLVDKFTPHLARHTLAKRASEKMDIRSVQTILGHKDLATTEIYLGAKDFKKAEEDYRKLEK